MDQRQKNILLLGLTAVLVAAAWFLLWPPQKKITQGLDLQGGLSVILTAESSQTVTANDMQRAETIVQNRVDGLGVKEASIQQQGNDSILVQIPGIKNPQEALQVLGSTGQLEFVNVSAIEDSATVNAILSQDRAKIDPAQYKKAVFMTGEVVKQATVSQNPNTGQVVVNVTMDSKGTDTWGQFTTANIGKPVAIVLDHVVQSAPTIRNAITDGRTEISGNFTAESAKQLATVLETGALPVTLVFSESRVVGPTLGAESLRQGLLAIVIGLTLVALYVLVFYRGLGLLTVGALVVFASMYMGILAGLSRLGFFSLSLPGIAGIVLTIGMAADSSILILERFKEEVRMGKTIRSAGNSGSRHGMYTSIDADLVTFVSALVLYFVAIGPVKGFALTLMIGIACDILMMVIFKRPSLVLLSESTIGKAPAFWGVPKETVVMPSAKGAKGGVARG